MRQPVPQDPSFHRALRDARRHHRRYQRVGNTRQPAAIRAQISVEASTDRLDDLVSRRAAGILNAIATPLIGSEFTAAKARLKQTLREPSTVTWLLKNATPVAVQRVSLETLNDLVLDWSEWYRRQVDNTKDAPVAIKDAVRKQARRHFDNVLCGLNQANCLMRGERLEELDRLASSLLYPPPDDLYSPIVNT